MTPPLRHPPLRPDWIDRPHQILSLGDFALESGESIANAHLCYVTHGELSLARDNAILVLSAIGATHHRLDFLIGPGRALDPARYFVVCVDALGNGLSSSPSNACAQAGMKFPRFTIRDMANSQARLLKSLGIERLFAVCGASMGGMQALQWAVSHPQRVGRLVAMTPMAKTSAWSRAINELSRQAMLADPRPNHALWAGIMRVLASRTPDALTRAMPDPEAVIGYLAELGADAVANGPDPIDWAYQTYAYDSHDVELELGRVTASALVLAPALDLYNPADEARRCAALMPRGVFVEIPSIEGHQAATSVDPADAGFLNRAIAMFLAEA